VQIDDSVVRALFRSRNGTRFVQAVAYGPEFTKILIEKHLQDGEVTKTRVTTYGNIYTVCGPIQTQRKGADNEIESVWIMRDKTAVFMTAGIKK
jgi:hypothetical protein